MAEHDSVHVHGLPRRCATLWLDDSLFSTINGHFSKLFERGGSWPLSEVLKNYFGTFIWTQDGCIDLKIIDTGAMYLSLPSPNRIRYRVIFCITNVPGVTSTFHDNLDRTANTDKQHRKAIQPPGTRRKNPQRS